MEKEVSSVVSLAATLIALSLVITLVMYTVIIGNSFKADVYETAVQMETDLESGQLSSLSLSETKIMAKATIFSILTQEHNVVSSLSCKAKIGADYLEVLMKPSASGLWVDELNNTTTEYVFPEDVMANNISGKASVFVSKNDYGTYDITIVDYEG